MIDFNGVSIKLTSKYQGIAYPWGGYAKEHHRVFVFIDGKRAQFDYYCNKHDMTEDELVNAFYCFVSDAVAYANAQDIDDFASEFGYTKITECMKAYKGCKSAYDKWQKFDLDVYDMLTFLQETYNL